jgi:glycosyltransferase involved in cell wall biosynthesis
MPAQPQPQHASLSVAIICRNNASTIGRTLESVRGLAAEIVAVDSGSTDATLDMLREHGARIVEHRWLGYAATKQLALEQCTRPWALSLDSDESLEPELRRAVEGLDLEREGGPTGYRVNRKVFYRGRFFEHTWQPEWRLRLVRRERFRWGGLDPHDELKPVAPGERLADLPGDLRHDSFASFAEMLAKQVGHARLMAQSLYDQGHRVGPLRLVVSPVLSFVRQAVFRRGYKDGARGWAAAGSMAAYTLMKYVCLLELMDQGGPRTPAGDADTAESAAGGPAPASDRAAG